MDADVNKAGLRPADRLPPSLKRRRTRRSLAGGGKTRSHILILTGSVGPAFRRDSRAKRGMDPV